MLENIDNLRKRGEIVNRQKVALLVLGLITTCLAGRTDAYWPYSAGQDWGYGYYSIYAHDYIPYYALHPPVYYSYQVSRPYGYSPFAYPPGTMTPRFETERLRIFEDSASVEQVATPEPQQTTSVPKRIVNPYVSGAAAADRLSATAAGKARPQIIYPASLRP